MPPNENRNDLNDAVPDDRYLETPVVEVTAPYRLPLWKKIAYGIGGPPMQMTSNTVGFFISIFLLETAMISPFYNSVIVFSGRVWDAITDPLVGYLVSKTDTRWGRQRPWLLFSAPIAAIGYFFLWYVPDIESMEWRFVYFLAMYLIYQAGVTAYHVPYSSMTVVLTDCQKDRDQATAFRMGFEVFGVLLGNIIFGFIITKYRVTPSNSHECENGTIVSGNGSDISIDQRSDARFGYLISAAVVCALYIFCCVVVFAFIRERRGGVVERREPYGRSIKPVFTFPPYTRLMLAFLFVSLGMQITQGNLALYTTHSLKRGEHMAFAIIILLCSAIAFVPVLQVLSSRFGKKTIFATCNLIYLPLLLVSTFLPEHVHPAFIYIFMLIAGVVVASAFLLPWSMLPDAIDAHMLEFGCRNEAAFYSFYVFFNKFAAGVSLGLSQIVLGLSGYNEKSLCPQPESVGRALRILFGPVPMVFVVISTIFVYLYPINESKRISMEKELRRMNRCYLQLEDTKMNRRECLDSSKSDRLSCVSSSATLPSMIHSVDDFNSRTALAPRSALVRSDSRV